MGIIRNSSNRKIKGRIGDTVYYESIGRQVARQALNNSNYGVSARRSESQQRRRVRWSNLVNFYKASRTWMPKAFETKKVGQTDYNRFMSVNVNTSKVALTKDEALQAACVVEGFIISQGSLPSIEVTPVSNAWRTSIVLGDSLNLDTCSVAEFSASVVTNNSGFDFGMQISFVSYQQFTTSTGVPQITCTFYEVTLDQSNTSLLREFLPVFAAQNMGGRLGTNDNISLGAFAYILSDTKRGALRVSSQSLITNNEALITAYSSTEQFEKAIDSYGVDDEVVLSPITENAQPVTPQSVGIDHIYANVTSQTYFPDAVLPKAQDLLSENVFIVTKGLPAFEVASVVFQFNAGAASITPLASGVSVDGSVVNISSAAWEGITIPNDYVSTIYLITTAGSTLIAHFDAGE